jgi:hypothetical protein
MGSLGEEPGASEAPPRGVTSSNRGDSCGLLDPSLLFRFHDIILMPESGGTTSPPAESLVSGPLPEIAAIGFVKMAPTFTAEDPWPLDAAA